MVGLRGHWSFPEGLYFGGLCPQVTSVNNTLEVYRRKHLCINIACSLEIISFQCSAAKIKTIFKYDFVLSLASEIAIMGLCVNYMKNESKFVIKHKAVVL